MWPQSRILPTPVLEYHSISTINNFPKTHPSFSETPQYANQPNSFYTVPPQELSIYYPQVPPSRDPPRSVYDTPRPQAYHMEQKPAMEHYALRPPSSHAHVIHGGSIPLSPAQPPSKTGSITTGFPVRTQTQYQQAPAPAALYTTQSRPIYQSPGTPINYIEEGREVKFSRIKQKNCFRGK